MFEAICIGNTQQIFNKRIDGHLSDIIHLLKKGQKLNSFAAHPE